MQLESYKTGIRYQFIHALSILIIAGKGFEQVIKRGLAINLFKVGVLLFSFSIYGLTLCNVFDKEGAKSILGPITPIGGLLLIAGWAVLLYGLLKAKD